MIPLAVPEITADDVAEVLRTLQTGFVSTVGPAVEAFERAVAEAAGSAHCIAVNSGTAGLHVALRAVGVERGDLVVVPDFSFIASATAIDLCGATPWFFDIEPVGLTLDFAAVDRALADCVATERGLMHPTTGRRIGAILAVHALGRPCDMRLGAAVAQKYRLPLVADAAAALGATLEGRPVGDWGADVSVLSFNGNKTITTGGGGAVLTADAPLAQRARHISTTARRSPTYEHDMVGYNYRMISLAAALGLAQLRRLDAYTARKRTIQAHYTQTLNGKAGLSGLADPPWGQASCWLATLLCAAPADAVSLRAALTAAGIDGRPFWLPLHEQAPYAQAPCFGSLEHTAHIAARIVTLPSSVALSDAELAHVVETVSRWAGA
jgi:perosamine synthetase